MSLHFEIRSEYSPKFFNEESECAIASDDFSELSQRYFEKIAKNQNADKGQPPVSSAPYFVALVEDVTNNSALYDYDKLRLWFTTKNWTVEGFTSPNTNERCRKVYILGIDKIGKVTPYATCETVKSVQDFVFDKDTPLKDSHFVKNIENFDKFPLSDDDIVHCLRMVFKDYVYPYPTTYEKALERFLKKGDKERTINLMEKLEKLYGDNGKLHECLAQYNDIISLERQSYHYERALVLTPPEEDTAHRFLLKLTEIYMKLGNYAKAIECANKRIKLVPKIAGFSHIHLGDIYSKLNFPEKAIESYKTLCNMVPEDIKTRMKLIEAYIKLENYAEAKKHLEKIISNDDKFSEDFLKSKYNYVRLEHATAFLHLGTIARLEKKFKEAAKYLEKAKLYTEHVYPDEDPQSIKLRIEEELKRLEPCKFRIQSGGYFFCQTNHCLLAVDDFEGLAEKHFERHTTPYFVALVEDVAKTSDLYDLTALRQFYQHRNWSEQDFKNPRTNQICSSVQILGINRLGKVSEFATCQTAARFERFSVTTPLENSAFYKDISNFPYFYQLSDGECLSWLDLILKDQQKSYGLKSFGFAMNQFMNKGNKDRKNDLMNKLERLYGDNAFVHQILAGCCREEKDFRKQAYHLEKALLLNPERSKVLYFLLADAYKNFGSFQEALDYIEKSLKHFPEDEGNYHLYNLLGEICIMQNRLKDALEALKKAVGGYPNFGISLIQLAETYKKLGNFEDARKYSLLTLKEYGHPARAYINLADISRLSDNFKEAKRYLNLAIEASPADWDRELAKSLIEDQKKLLAVKMPD